MFHGLDRGTVGGGRNIKPEIPKKICMPGVAGGILAVLPIEKTVVVPTATGQNEMLAVSVERRQIVGVGIRIAGEQSDASVVALSSDTRVVIYRPRGVVDVQQAVSMHGWSRGSEGHDIYVVSLRGHVAVRVPGFYVHRVGPWGEGYPGINRRFEITEDIYIINVDHISGDVCSVFGGGLEVDGRDQIRCAVR